MLIKIAFTSLAVLTFLPQTETNSHYKDSAVIVRQQGPDKKYFKSCKGQNIIIIYDENWKMKTVFLDGKINGSPYVPGFFDTKCPINKSLLRMISNDSLKAKSN
ncbi:MAG: hypothetical protein J0L69_01925 [Bacteroidetes bacterium]|nr:hypothetical protein [Bacteroidota bacterium]